MVLVSGLFFYSCEDSLKMKKDNTWEDKYTWGMADGARAVLNKAYQGNNNLPDSFGEAFLDAATDNAVAANRTSAAWLAGNGGISKTNSVIGNWSLCYNMFQYVHEFLRKGLGDDVLYYRPEESKPQDQAMKKRLEGEAYFLRAWWGFQLLQRYGGRAADGQAYGYPIVTEFIDEDNLDDPKLFTRNTYEECVQQILTDCDVAIEKLPVYWNGASELEGTPNIGRASGMAAALLRSRVALYAASPAYQDNTVVTIDGMGAYTVVDQQAYRVKWERAARMAKEAMNMTGFGAYTFQIAAKFAANPCNENNEFVFRARTSGNRNLENRHGPPSNFGLAQTQPSHNLYLACPVADGGYPLSDPRSGYDPDEPYALTLGKRGTNLFYRHGSDYGSYTLANSIPTENHSTKNYFNLAYGNVDTPAYSSNATMTGYYLKKFILPTIITDYANMGSPSQRFNPYLRRAEAFFNYAEAMNELYGPGGTGNVGGMDLDISAMAQMKEIRTKAGITTDTYIDECTTTDLMRELIQNERRLEFAFENHRFFDMRRWLMPLSEPVLGIKITYGDDGGYDYEVYTVETRPMNEVKYYFLPLPEAELQKSPELKNNMGW
jgi:hypothetical protein